MLIVTMGILALLSVMAIAFTRLVKLESDSSTNYLDMIRAEQLAKSGQERAKVGLQDVATGQAYDSINDPWVFKDEAGNLAAGTLIEDADKTPYSGSLGGRYGNKEGLSYKVKVLDCASQINVNGKQKRMAEMLDNLAAAITKNKGVANPLIGLDYKGSTGGKAIVSFRNVLINGKYSSKMQLLELFQESERAKDTKDADKVGLEKYNVIKDYVTANSWVNEKTVKGLQNPDPKIAPMYSNEPRAPINVNTATREVLIACIQGLAGRGRYVGARVSTQPIDQDAPEYHILPGEEITSLDEIIDFVYVEPLTQGQAEKIAELIDNRRSSRPFRSYADFEYFVDTVIPAGMLPQYKPSLHPADDRNIDHFKVWYEQAARDVLKTNFNPNARPSHFNPSVSTRMIVDKANLWMKDKDDMLTEMHTTEFCFSSMGYFEITSLGQVLDRKEEIVAESKVRTVVKLFDTIMHTSQKEFELAQDDDKLDIATYPQNVVAFDGDGHEDIGYIELYPSEDALAPQSADLYKLLVVKFDQENYDKANKLSIANGEAATAMTFQPDPLSSDPKYGSNIKCGLMPKDSDVLPDGIYFSKFKGSYLARLRYRASSPVVNGPSNPKSAGIAQGEVNIPTYSGAIEFWIKPDFDSTAKVFAGYVSVSSYLTRTVGGGGDSRQYRGGTQLYLFKDTDGALRLTRLYYESFFDATGKLFPNSPPYPGDFDLTNPDSFPPYPADRPYNPEPPATPPPKYPIGRPLPDVNDKLLPVHARTDVLVDHDTWGGWKAGEWHHVMIAWDDGVFENDMSKKNCCLRLFIDGRYMPGVVYQYAATKAVLVNEIAPADYIFVGGIHRNQKFPPKGLFKFGSSNSLAITANATIDNFVTYYENALTVASGTPPFRYPISGTYTNYITIPFPPGVDKVKLRAIEFAAYAPAKFALGANGIKNPVDLITATGERSADVLAGGDAPGVVVRLFPAGNKGVTIGPGTELQRDPTTGAASIGYEVTLMGLSPVGHAAPLVSPAFDSIQISYFLPREEVVLFEKVVE
jgi:hypothetical protein